MNDVMQPNASMHATFQATDRTSRKVHNPLRTQAAQILLFIIFEVLKKVLKSWSHPVSDS
jgi:hypothetical protein